MCMKVFKWSVPAENGSCHGSGASLRTFFPAWSVALNDFLRDGRGSNLNLKTLGVRYTEDYLKDCFYSFITVIALSIGLTLAAKGFTIGKPKYSHREWCKSHKLTPVSKWAGGPRGLEGPLKCLQWNKRRGRKLFVKKVFQMIKILVLTFNTRNKARGVNCEPIFV